MATYLLLQDLKGNVQSKNHCDWIAINSLDFTISRHMNTLPGQIFDRELSRPNISEIILEKYIDVSSALLFQYACSAKIIKCGTIDLCQTNQTDQAYTQIKLNNIVVTYFKLNSNINLKQSRPTETIKLNFDQIEIRYTPFDKNNKATNPISAGFDLKQAVVM